jgi:porphobilinogen synthase
MKEIQVVHDWRLNDVSKRNVTLLSRQSILISFFRDPPKNGTMNAQRPRRNRKNQAVRHLVAETHLQVEHLIYPLFVVDGQDSEIPLRLLPGQSRLSLDRLLLKMPEWMDLGLRHFALFPAIDDSLKDSRAQEALNENGLLPRILKTLISDVALDPYSSDGHDGIVRDGKILNDESVEVLAQMALAHARWGADWVAPSDMMDGRVGAIRRALDQSGFSETSILSYAAKYASSFYGPFREALNSAPKHGDKKTYQMDYRNSREALREARLDMEEGADMLMVKPGLPYLDVVRLLKDNFEIPIAAYQVSGEYAMLKFAALQGAIDEDAAILETLTAFRRAGSDAILTYFAPQAARLLHLR